MRKQLRSRRGNDSLYRFCSEQNRRLLSGNPGSSVPSAKGGLPLPNGAPDNDGSTERLRPHPGRFRLGGSAFTFAPVRRTAGRGNGRMEMLFSKV